MFYFKKTIQKSFLVINGAAPTAQLLFVRRELAEENLRKRGSRSLGYPPPADVAESSGRLTRTALAAALANRKHCFARRK